MILKTKLIASGVVALATTIGVLTTPFNSDKLSSAIQKNQAATHQAIIEMKQANSVIIQLDKKVATDNKKINALNIELGNALNKNNHKNLSQSDQKIIVRELLESWGYHDRTITYIIDILEGIAHIPWFGNLNTTNHK